MQRRRLGRSGITVSEICLGTMTFGAQADEAESFRIMDAAYERGVNFLDVAEIYPSRPAEETIGITEEIVGRWLKTKPRESVIVATKVTGPGHGWFPPPVRHAMTALDGHHIRTAIEGSLRRLQTDYLDLYQTHWPDHGMRYEDTLAVLTKLVDEGKVRVLGCSNETCWGVMKSLQASEKHTLRRYDTVQNNFSLINRRCESELAQVCRQEGLSLLPYSPLGGGVLTCKYCGDGDNPPGARFTDYLAEGGERQKRMAQRFVNPRTLETASRLGQIAKEISLSAPPCRSPGASSTTSSPRRSSASATSINWKKTWQPPTWCSTRKHSPKSINLMSRFPPPMTEDGLRRL